MSILFSYFVDMCAIGIVLELCEKGNLKLYLEQMKSADTEDMISPDTSMMLLKFSLDVACGMEHIARLQVNSE